MLHKAVNVSDRLLGEGIKIGVVNTSCPIDVCSCAVETALSTGFILTYEDHHVRTGVGCTIAKMIAGKSKCSFISMGITRYGGSAHPDRLYEDMGLSERALLENIKKELSSKE